MNIAEDNTTHNVKNFILDPLSVIIKLAIIGNKPVGTKIHIANNNIYLQEPGPFQALCRYVMKTNKTDLHYLYNPIYLACCHFLTRENVEKTPRIRILFQCALKGLDRLIDTYATCSIIRLTLYFYHVIISNYLEIVVETKGGGNKELKEAKESKESKEAKAKLTNTLAQPTNTLSQTTNSQAKSSSDRSGTD